MANDPLAGESPKVSTWSGSPIQHAIRSYVAFLQNLFAELKDTDKDAWHYSDDEKETKINIGMQTPMDAAQVAGRPAIIVSPQGIDSQGGIIGTLDDLDPMTGRVTYLEMFRSGLGVYVISREPTEAHNIAWFIAESTWALHRTLISNAGFHLIGFNIRVGPPLPPGSLVGGDLRGPLVAAPLMVPYTFLRRCSVVPVNAPKLNHVNLHLRPVGAMVPGPRPSVPIGWTVEKWLAKHNQGKGGYQIPSDPSLIIQDAPPPLPTEGGPGRQSEGEVIVRVDLIE